MIDQSYVSDQLKTVHCGHPKICNNYIESNLFCQLNCDDTIERGLHCESGAGQNRGVYFYECRLVVDK